MRKKLTLPKHLTQVSRQSVLYPSAAKLRSIYLYQHDRRNFTNMFKTRHKYCR